MRWLRHFLENSNWLQTTTHLYIHLSIVIVTATHLWLVWSPWQHCCSHCSWWPQYWQCVSHCRAQRLEHLFHWWWLDWGLDWQWWCSWLEPHHHIVGAATALCGSHCPDHTVEQWRRESGEGRENLLGRTNKIRAYMHCTVLENGIILYTPPKPDDHLTWTMIHE